MNLKKALAPVAIVAALGVAACGDDEDEGGSSSTESTPSVSFVSPTDGDTTAGEVTAEVELQGFEINPADVGMRPKPNEGHLHFTLDGGKFDRPKYSGANGELAVKLGVDGKYSPSTEPQITYSGLPKGEHTLEVALANNDHSDTGTTASTTFTVE